MAIVRSWDGYSHLHDGIVFLGVLGGSGYTLGFTFFL